MARAKALVKDSRMSRQEVQDLALAKSLLERPGFAARLFSVIGAPIEKGFKLLPSSWTDVVHRAVRLALWNALNIAVTTLDSPRFRWSRRLSHKVLLGMTGGLGGAFGLAALPIELPISTGLMLRGIAEVGRSEGFDLERWETRVACLEVFAIGGAAPKGAPAEAGYWMVRSALGKAVQEATVYLAQRAALEGGAPVLARLIETIAARFGTIVSEQVAAKAVPLLGGVAGSAINVMFMDHFQRVALGHFIVKRLEARYGALEVRSVYQQIPYSRDISVAV